MSATVGELFVNLGIKGADKTLGAIEGVKGGLKDTASMSLEAKAAIVGAMYALERLFQTSGAAGTGLRNFNALVGVGAKELQQYQYAARQVGVSNESVAGTFKNLQGAMSKVLMGESAPKGLGLVAGMTGGINPSDIADYAKNPALLLQRLQEYALKDQNIGRRNEVLKSFGLGDDMVSALARNAFNNGSLSKAPTYSDREINALDRANIAWSNLATHIEMAVGHFNAMHGGQLVRDITLITDKILKLTEALIIFADKIKVFDAISKVMGVTADVIGAVTPGGAVMNWRDRVDKSFFNLWDATAPKAHGFDSQIEDQLGQIKPIWAGGFQKTSPNVNINQNLHFQHDGKDHKRTGDSVKKSIQDAYRQMSAQGQGS